MLSFWLSTNLVMGKRGACTSIPRKLQTLNSLRGTEMRYSWKQAEVRNTTRVAVVREAPELTRGLYRCLIHLMLTLHRQLTYKLAYGGRLDTEPK